MTRAAAPLSHVQLTLDGRGCVVCGAAIPAGSRSHRQTCSATCRQRASRQERRESVTGPEVAPTSTPTASPAASLSPPAPGANLAAIAAGIATLVDAYGPVRAYCEVRDGGFGAVAGSDGGRVNEPAGPVFLRPRLAIDLADLLNARLIARTGTTYELVGAPAT